MTYINRHRATEKGSALVYILIAIALLAALTVTFMEPSSQQTSSQSSFRTVTSVQSQSDVIRSAIQECVLRYSNGDTAIPTGSNAMDEGANTAYPIRPDSDYYTPATLGPTAGRLVRDIRCPGNHPAGSAVDHGRVFGSGKFLGPAPELFNDWQYYNGTDGVFFWTSTAKSDAFLLTSLEKLDEKYGECEADVTDATGGALSLTSASAGANNSVSCTAGHVCFRVWMISNAASQTLVNVDSGCE